MLYIGCHLSAARGYAHMGREALRLGANTFQFFTRNPRGGAARAADEADAAALRELMEKHGFGKIVAHAPYTLNPCSSNPKTRAFARLVLEEDLERMELLPGNYYNFHPGSHVGQGSESGIRQIAGLLNEVLSSAQTTIVLLETMAGKGSEIGRSFEELKTIIDRVELSEKVGVCMDTCHLHDAGYDVAGNWDSVLETFDRTVGLSRLRAVHINDSRNPAGARKDRHARIGEGFVGTDALAAVVSHPRLEGIPFLLETPNEPEGYAEEIALLKSRYRKQTGFSPERAPAKTGETPRPAARPKPPPAERRRSEEKPEEKTKET